MGTTAYISLFGKNLSRCTEAKGNLRTALCDGTLVVLEIEDGNPIRTVVRFRGDLGSIPSAEKLIKIDQTALL